MNNINSIKNTDSTIYEFSITTTISQCLHVKVPNTNHDKKMINELLIPFLVDNFDNLEEYSFDYCTDSDVELDIIQGSDENVISLTPTEDGKSFTW